MQGSQMVDFQTKKSLFGQIWDGLGMENVIDLLKYFTDILAIL
jgi:hypothetical protein